MPSEYAKLIILLTVVACSIVVQCASANNANMENYKNQIHRRHRQGRTGELDNNDKMQHSSGKLGGDHVTKNHQRADRNELHPEPLKFVENKKFADSNDRTQMMTQHGRGHRSIDHGDHRNAKMSGQDRFDKNDNVLFSKSDKQNIGGVNKHHGGVKKMAKLENNKGKLVRNKSKMHLGKNKRRNFKSGDVEIVQEVAKKYNKGQKPKAEALIFPRQWENGVMKQNPCKKGYKRDLLGICRYVW